MKLSCCGAEVMSMNSVQWMLSVQCIYLRYWHPDNSMITYCIS